MVTGVTTESIDVSHQRSLSQLAPHKRYPVDIIESIFEILQIATKQHTGLPYFQRAMSTTKNPIIPQPLQHKPQSLS